jgi:hypothetical protein
MFLGHLDWLRQSGEQIGLYNLLKFGDSARFNM